MNQATTFTKPDWDKCEERDVTGEFFQDLNPEGDTTITALFDVHAVNYGGHYFNRDVEESALLHGVRVEHPGLTEWVDAASLIAMFGRQEFYAAQEWVAS